MANNEWDIGLGVKVDTSDVQKQLDKKNDATLEAAIKIKSDKQSLQNEIDKIQTKFKDKIGFSINNTEALKSIQETQKAYVALRKEAYQSIGIKSPQLQEMAQFYSQQEKEAEKISKIIEANRKKAISFTSDMSNRLSKAINKYSYGDGNQAKSILEKMNLGVSNFSDLKNINPQIESYSKKIDSVIDKLKSSHIENLNYINEEIKREKEAEIQKEKHLKTIQSLKNDYYREQFQGVGKKSDISKEMSNYYKQQEKDIQDTLKSTATQQQRLTQANTMKSWIQNNSRSMKQFGSSIDEMIAKLRSADDLTVPELNKIKASFTGIKLEAREAGKLGKSFGDRLKEQASKFAEWVGISGLVMKVILDFKQSVAELKEANDELTEISKTSDMTKESLVKLGNEAYDSASKYGKVATDYLASVREMSRSGFYDEAGKQMAELSLQTQSAGDLTQDLADKFLLSTNAAYKYHGSISNLSAVVDGANQITNRNSVAMNDMSAAMSKAGYAASTYGVKVNELAALTGTAVAQTKKTGDEVGTALKSIFINLQNVSSDKIRGTFDSLNISMTKFVNGSELLKTPIELIKELQSAYNKLPEGSIDKANVLKNIGGKHHANVLSAILGSPDEYEKMLKDYSEGIGSAFEESEKSANNWTGRINALKNATTELVSNFVNSDMMTGATGGLVKFVNGLDDIIEKIGVLPVLIAGVNVALVLSNKDNIKELGESLYKVSDILSDGLGEDSIKSLADATSNLTDKNTILLLSQKGLDEQTIRSVLLAKGLSAEEVELSMSKYQSATASGFLATAEGVLAGITTSLSNSVKGLWLTLKSNPLILITTLITTAISVFSAFKNKSKEASDEVIEAANNAKQASEEISNLYGKYSDLTKKVKENKASKEELVQSQNQLLQSLGIESSKVDELTEKYGILSTQVNDLVHTATLEKLKDEQRNLVSAVDEYEKKLLKVGKNGFFHKNSFVIDTKNISEFENKLKDIEGVSTYIVDNVRRMDLGGDNSLSGLNQNYNTLKSIAGAMEEIYSKEELQKDNLYKDITARIGNLKDAYDEYNTAIADVNNNQAYQDIVSSLKGNELPKTKDDFDKLKNSIIASAIASKDYIGSQEDIQNAVITTLSSMGTFSSFMTQSSADTQNLSNDVDETTDSIESLGDVLSNFDSYSSKIAKAIEKVKSGSVELSDVIGYLKEFGIDINKIDMTNFNGLEEELKRVQKLYLETTLAGIKESGQVSDETFTKLSELLKGVSDDALKCSSSINSISTAIKSVDSVSNGMKEINSAFKEFKDDGKVSFETISKMSEKFGDLKSFEKFSEIANNSNSSTKQLNDSIDNLVGEYLEYSGVLDKVNIANAEWIATGLREYGIVNALDVVLSKLGITKEDYATITRYCKDNSIDLSNATIDEIETLCNEINVADDTKESLHRLVLQKETANGITLTTDGDIKNLTNLVKSCGGATTALTALAKAKRMYDAYKSGDWSSQYLPQSGGGLGFTADYTIDDWYQDQLKAAQKEAEDALKLNVSGNNKNTITNPIIKPSYKYTDKSKSKKDKKSKSDKDTKQTFDFIETRLDRLNKQYDKQKNLANDIYTTYKNQNKELDVTLNKSSKILSENKKAYDLYISKAKSVGLSENIAKKVRDGSYSITDYSSKTAEKINQYKQWYDKAQALKENSSNIRRENRSLSIQKVENIKDDYSKKLSYQNSLLDGLNAELEYRQAIGDTITETDYDVIIGKQNKIKELTETQYKLMKSEFQTLVKNGTIKKYSDDWYDYTVVLAELGNDIEDCNKNLLETNKLVSGIKWSNFDKGISQINNIKSELSSVLSLLNQDNFIIDGKITSDGYTALSLYGKQINTNTALIQEYGNAIGMLHKDLNMGKITQDEYNEKLQDFKSIQFQLASEIKSTSDAILNFKVESLNSEKDAYKKVVDEQIKAIEKEKELHDLQRQGEADVKNLSRIQAKITTLRLSGGDKEKALALKLENELANQKEEIEEKAYQNSVSSRIDALNESYSQFEKSKNDEIDTLKRSSDKQEQVVKNMLNSVQGNYNDVLKNIESISSQYGVTLTDNLTNPWIAAEDAVNKYKKAIESISGINNINSGNFNAIGAASNTGAIPSLKPSKVNGNLGVSVIGGAGGAIPNISSISKMKLPNVAKNTTNSVVLNFDNLLNVGNMNNTSEKEMLKILKDKGVPMISKEISKHKF